MVVGWAENQFSSGVWPLLGCPCPVVGSTSLHIRATHAEFREEEEKEEEEREEKEKEEEEEEEMEEEKKEEGGEEEEEEEKLGREWEQRKYEG